MYRYEYNVECCRLERKVISHTSIADVGLRGEWSGELKHVVLASANLITLLTQALNSQYI